MPSEAQIPLEDPGIAHNRVLALGFGFFAFVGLSLAGLGVYFHRVAEGVTTMPAKEYPAPRLETRHLEDITGLLRSQRDQVQNYAWVDRGKGIIRVPVARAMELILARGAAAYDPLDAPASARKTIP